MGEVFSEESFVVYDFTTAVDEVDSEWSAVDFSSVREGGADCTSEDCRRSLKVHQGRSKSRGSKCTTFWTREEL